MGKKEGKKGKKNGKREGLKNNVRGHFPSDEQLIQSTKLLYKAIIVCMHLEPPGSVCWEYIANSLIT